MDTSKRENVKPAPLVVPRWLVRTIWMLHRALYSVTRGRLGLRTPAAGRWGMLRLTTIGRRTGRTRVAILGYLEDGPNLLIPAMNGWADPEPAWWLNLQANPDATIVLPGGATRRVVARGATTTERPRLWAKFVDLGTAAYTDESAALRSRETAIAILEPPS